MNEEGKIISDENWKERAQREKERLSAEIDGQEASQASDPPLPEPSFSLFLAGLASEAYMALGEIENPVTKEKKFEAAHAQYAIDLMEIIKTKTAGNLAPEEAKELEAILYDCRMRFVARTKSS